MQTEGLDKEYKFSESILKKKKKSSEGFLEKQVYIYYFDLFLLY